MTARIGKLSFIFNLVISLAILLAPLLKLIDPYYLIYYYYIDLTIPSAAIVIAPLVMHLFCTLLALPFAFIGGAPANNKLSTKSFNWYLYIGTASTLLLALLGLFLFNMKILPKKGLEIAAIAFLYIAVINMLISTITAKAIQLKTSNKLATALLIGLSLCLFASFGGLYHFTRVNSTDKTDKFDNYPDMTYQTGNSIMVPESDTDDTEEDNEYDELPEDQMGLQALRYFYSKMVLAHKNEPFELLQYWNWWGWKDDDDTYKNIIANHNYNNYSPTMKWENKRDFNTAKHSFYHLYDLTKEKDITEDIFSHYADIFMENINSSTYTNSSLNQLVNAAILSYNDLYTRDDTDQVLQWIYKVMSDPKNELPQNDEEPVGHWRTSEYYPYLEKYMSHETIRQMQYEEDENQNKAVIVWAYSFWARRHNKGTDKMAHTILSTIQSHYEE